MIIIMIWDWLENNATSTTIPFRIILSYKRFFIHHLGFSFFQNVMHRKSVQFFCLLILWQTFEEYVGRLGWLGSAPQSPSIFCSRCGQKIWLWVCVCVINRVSECEWARFFVHFWILPCIFHSAKPTFLLLYTLSY